MVSGKRPRKQITRSSTKSAPKMSLAMQEGSSLIFYKTCHSQDTTSWNTFLWVEFIRECCPNSDSDSPVPEIFWDKNRQSGIEGNERVDQLAKKTLDQERDPLASVHYTDLKPLVNSCIQQLVQTKWGVAVHGRDLYLVKPTLGQLKKFQRLTRAEEVVITRPRIGHTKAHILSRGPLTTVVKHCTLTIYSWSVQWYKNAVTNSTQLTRWIPSLILFQRLA